jgi:hypothetical protein
VLYIPKRTKDLLELDQKYNGFVLSCISNVSEWLGGNKTVFFPEYTDHGLAHLKEVLLTADSIISDESWDVLTAQDTAALIVSVLLHDCALHISEDGFYTLITDKFPAIKSRYLAQEVEWSVLWSEFMQEAKRFDAKKIAALFNDETPVRDIPENKIDLSGRDRLLIGEFIRRYHARIAHEIAFNGVPGVGGKTLSLAIEPDTNFLDLCGYIARSHNMDLRSAVDRLEKNKKQVHLSCHVPFVMLVLRISDYIQIHAQRAPKNLLNIKSLVSPISRGEWEKHASIVEINNAHDDPEAIYIDAEPQNALAYESLVKLFRDIQKELDLSWSVLGEVYGRYEHLNLLGITIRRIRTSLDNLQEFIKVKKPNYIPKVLKFKTADSEMMELLIKPLYGDKPEIGIRELLQNSIDACVELNDFLVKNNVSSKKKTNHDVVITLTDRSEGGGELTIEDYGIGMTLEIVENYFLNIGASFRNSDRWKKEHETEGHSNVYRTGRFGIGLLAAYLLGDEIRVETRHVREDATKGLSFSCKKGSDSIIVTNLKTHIGTKISVTITDNVKLMLLKGKDKWDWFSLSNPKVIRKIVTEEKEYVLDQSRLVPNSGELLEDETWNRSIAEGYDDLLWTYKKIGKSNQYWRSPNLICNGIIVTKLLNINNFEISSQMKIIKADTPSLVVFDQDGRLPINLERSDIVGNTLPFGETLSQDISDYLAKQIIDYCKPLKKDFSKSLLGKILNLPIKGLNDGQYSNMENTCKLIVSGDSLLPMDFDLIKRQGIKNIYIDAANLSQNQGAWSSNEFNKYCENYLIVDKITSSKKSRSAWVRAFFELRPRGYGELRPEKYRAREGINMLPIVGRRILIKKCDIADIVTTGYVPKTFWEKLRVDWENDNWRMLSIGKNPIFEADLDRLVAEFDASRSFGVILCSMEWKDEVESEKKYIASLFSNSWLNENNQQPLLRLETV